MQGHNDKVTSVVEYSYPAKRSQIGQAGSMVGGPRKADSRNLNKVEPCSVLGLCKTRLTCPEG